MGCPGHRGWNLHHRQIGQQILERDAHSPCKHKPETSTGPIHPNSNTAPGGYLAEDSMNQVAKVTEQPKALETQEMSESAALISMIGRAASDPNVDIDKMERLLQMQERVLDRNAAKEYAQALVRTQKAMPSIRKDKENRQTNSWYSSLEAINRAITPIYTREGFSLSFSTDDSPLERHVRVVCDVIHASGHTKSYHYDCPIDDVGIGGKTNKTQTHGRGSAISYGQRYLTKLIFNLTIGGEDDDGNGGDAGQWDDWYMAIEGADSMIALTQLGEELKNAGIPANALKFIRSAWSRRATELKAKDKAA